ncbi:MAG TPA: maleylpyruvate isomerase N-terminal domain-containing protein, partial [Acidimicrobiales bacterium]|nr:maleylpyruvate isomerase N-terminal domain-containing protein [Acidimicrobiales bacterium]
VAWTVRDVVAHTAGNAEELARILRAHLEGGPVPATRTFADREAPFRRLSDGRLLDALEDEVSELTAVVGEAAEADAEEFVSWTGRKMKVAWFAEHMREELILHRWDIVGDDEVSTRLLSQPWVTEHAVVAVGPPLLRRGLSRLPAGRRFTARLRCEDRDDVVVTAGEDSAVIELAPPEGPAVLETDPAARVLLLWGRQPADPARIYSAAGTAALGEARLLLSGY